MSLSALVLYAAVYFAAVATPGPGVAALAAHVLGQGLGGIVPYILGFVVGDLIWLTLAATGLAMLAHSFAAIFFAVRIMGAAYLLYVAWGLFRAHGALAPAASRRPTRAFFGALSLTLGNPKVIVFFLSIMPLAVDLSTLTLARFAVLGGVTAVVLSATLSAYALAAHRARALMRSSRALGAARKAAAGVMAGVAVTLVTR